MHIPRNITLLCFTRERKTQVSTCALPAMRQRQSTAGVTKQRGRRLSRLRPFVDAYTGKIRMPAFVRAVLYW